MTTQHPIRWFSIIYWPISAVLIRVITLYGRPIIINPAGDGLWRQHVGFPISYCYYGPFEPGGFAGVCSDAAPPVYDMVIVVAAAVVVYLVAVVVLKKLGRKPNIGDE